MKKLLLVLALIGVVILTAYGALSGTYTTNSYFYLPGYGSYGTEEYAAYNAAMEVADNAIKDNETAAGDENIQGVAGGMFSDNTEVFIDLEYQDSDGTVDATVPVKDEDNMASDSATFLCTQQSIKAHADTLHALQYLKTEMNEFSEIQAIVADKTLVNEEDVCTIDANWVNIANPWADNEVADNITCSNYQPLDTALTNISALTYISPSFIKLTANDTYAVRTLAEVRTDLGLVIGTNVQAYDTGLTSLAGLTYASDSFVKVTATDVYAIRTLTETKTDLSLNYVENLKVKLDGTAAPAAATDDITLGYTVGSRWFDVTNDKEYVCLDNTDGAAVWTETTQSGGGGAFTGLSDTPANYTGEAGKYVKVNAGEDALEFGTPAGGGDVSKVGTPANSQIGVWTGDGTIEGAASLTYDGSNLGLTGDIGITGTRITKGWFTDFEVTNAIAGSITGNAATCTTASEGDAAVDFFGAGVDAVTDATTCTDIEGTLLAIGGTTLNAAIPADHVTYDMMQDATATDKILGRSTAGAGTIEEIACTAAGRAVLDDADASAQRTTLGLVIGTDVEVDLSNEAGLYAVLSDVALFLEDTIDDTSPELGGEMDAGAHSIGFTQQTVSYNSATTTVDWKLSNKASMTFGAGNITTFAFTNPTNPCNVLLKIVQDATGSRVVTAWDADIKWAGGSAPTLSTGANAIDIISFYWDGTNYFGVASLNFS